MDTRNKDLTEKTVRMFSESFEVSGHPRRLHEGSHRSVLKTLEIQEMGLDLDEEFTLVDTYVKGDQSA